MSELNEEVQVQVDDASVITVPIDDTLAIQGQAADSKAVGDALALKADRSELSTAVNVNGQGADAQGTILLYGDDIPMAEDEATTLTAAVEALQGMDAGDINVDNDAASPQTVQAAITSLQSKTGEGIDLDSTGAETIAAAVADFTDAEIAQMFSDAGY